MATIPQTTVQNTQALGFAGQRFPTPDMREQSFNATATVTAGYFVMRSTDPALQCKPLTTSAVLNDLLGVAMLDELSTGLTFAAGKDLSVARRGLVVMATEDACVAGGQVFVRKITSGNEVAGAVRATSDGTAQVWTATPTAGNTTQYGLRITITGGASAGQVFELFYLSDGSGTATEICDGLRTELNANALLAALITESGTATLILTATDKDTQFDVDALTFAGAFASITETTPAVDDCIAVPLTMARFESAADAGGLAIVSLSLV
jgi:hypothetical protein